MAMARRTCTLHARFDPGAKAKTSDIATRQFGIRNIEYQVPDSENLTLSVNGVRVMRAAATGASDEAMKRVLCGKGWTPNFTCTRWPT